MVEKSKKMKNCTSCEAEIAKSAKVCPNCGAKNKKPIYKRAWFIVLVVFVVIGTISSMGNSDENTTNNSATSTNTLVEKTTTEELPKAIEYIAYDVKELINDLDNNALKAEKKYSDAYVELTGKLSTIDSDGKYISLTPTNDKFAIMGVQCYVQNDEQLDKVLEMKTGDVVVLKGQIKDIGEIMGYTLDIDTIQ